MNIDNIRTAQNFTSTSKTTNEEKDEKMPTLSENISKAIENIYNRSERSVPENGKFTGIECQFPIPGSDIIGTIVFMCDDKEPKDKRYLFVRALGLYPDDSRSTMILNDTKENIRNYLISKEGKDEIQKAIVQLQNSIIKSRY